MDIRILSAVLLINIVAATRTVEQVNSRGTQVTKRINETFVEFEKEYYPLEAKIMSQLNEIHRTVNNLLLQVSTMFQANEVMANAVKTAGLSANPSNWMNQMLECADNLKNPAVQVYEHVMKCVEKSNYNAKYENATEEIYQSFYQKFYNTAEKLLNCDPLQMGNDIAMKCITDIEEKINFMRTNEAPSTLREMQNVSAVLNGIPNAIRKCYQTYPFSSLKGVTLLVPEVENCLANVFAKKMSFL